ncbi:GroES-like protein [Xylaria telfairii]|nr:GroES-like protein [Xylaria telfairii]
MPGTHKAAILPQKDTRLTIVERATPEPGPNEILVEVKAVALNPVDYYQRDFGFPPVPFYPAMIGTDASGIVVKVGSKISTVAPGARVIAFASSFYQGGSMDHAAFQQYALAQSEGVIPLPDNLSFEQGSVFPLCFMTALTAWTSIGISLDTKYTLHDKQAVLIWGASSSVGAFAVQTAKIMGFTVYATASPTNHGYIRELGADTVFDYKTSDVISQIIATAEKDGVNLLTAHCVVPDCLEPVLEILKQTKGDAAAKVAHSPPLPSGHATLDNTNIVFNFPSMDAGERDPHMFKCFHEWLQGGLRSGSIVPSPAIQIEDGGLEGLNAALDKLKAGVSATKIVVRV